MQFNILKTKLVVGFSLLFLFVSSCNKTKDLENQITIKIKCIDRETKQPRTFAFDTIKVWKEAFSFLPIKSYKQVAEYTTDSTGSVEIKLDRNEGYDFLLSVKNFYGSADYTSAYTKEKLKDGQEVIIEAFRIGNE